MAYHAEPPPFGSGRTSRQRERIVSVIDGFGRAFTAEELVDALARTDTAPGVATVYRALGALEDTGYIVRVGERDGAALYARCDLRGHHHHLVCVSCGSVAPASCPIDDATRESARREGFLITDHEVTLYGICRTCLANGVKGSVH